MAVEWSWENELKRYLNTNSGFINMGWAATSAHRGTEIYFKTALRFVKKDWPHFRQAFHDYSFFQIDKHSHLFSYALKRLGIKKGDVVFSLCPRLPEFYVTAIGSLKRGTVFAPLFSAFGPEPILTRLNKGQGRVLFTLTSLYKKKIAPIRDQLTSLEHIVLLDDSEEGKGIPGAIDFYTLLEEAEGDLHFDWHESDMSYWWSDQFIEKTDEKTPALLHFTSGTTGQPKGALHTHGATIFHLHSGPMALDFESNDTFWCTADPGWVTGMSYGVISPLLNGITSIVDEAEFEAERWYRILQDFKVTVWYTAPTALRMLMQQGEDLPQQFNLDSVRFVASVGEPLNREVILWAEKNLKFTIHDNWWQTETGGIIIANLPNTKVKPGSMGKPLPGLQVRLMRRRPNGAIEFITKPHERGEIAIHRDWPALFLSYLNDEERYRKCFHGDWYLSGDLATFDEDGYYWFVGRSDDVIKSSGHLIGPFEVESAILEHPLVAEAGVIGVPDPIAGEVVKAFVSLKKSATPSDNLGIEILRLTRTRLGPAVAPRSIGFLPSLPKTRSGKIMRRLLRARELGLPEGDTSTLEMNP